MEEILKQLKGKKVDISCGASEVFRGDVMDVKDEILYLQDEDERTNYIALDKICRVSECSDQHSKPGFIS